MSVEENKGLVRRFIGEVFEQGRLEAVDELCADDFIGHTWGNADKDGLKAAAWSELAVRDPRHLHPVNVTAKKAPMQT